MRRSAVRLTSTLLTRRATGDLATQLTNAENQQAAAVEIKARDPKGMAPGFTSLDVFTELRIVSLPSTRGSLAADVRKQLAQEETLSVARMFMSPSAPAAGRTVVVVGDAGIGYLRRLLVLEALNVAQLIVVDRSLSVLARSVRELGGALRGRFCGIRSDEAFVLQNVLLEEYVDVLVLANPHPFPGTSNSNRLLTRDNFNLAHQCLKKRMSPDDACGIVMWTSSAKYLAFALGQLEESKLVVPWARKNPAVFGSWLPQDDQASMAREKHILCISKTEKTSDLARQLNASYSYARRKYPAF